MEALLETQPPRLAQTPLGQPFVDHIQGFGRPFSDRFSPQDDNLFWNKAVFADAAAFLFPPGARWYEAAEVEMRVRGEGRRFGVVDCVLYSLGIKGWDEIVTGYGSVIMQPTRRSRDEALKCARTWYRIAGPDDLAAVRAYLMNQLVFEGGMYSLWDRKMAVALEQNVHDTLPPLDEVGEQDAAVAWLIYDLIPDDRRLTLKRRKVVCTKYPESWGKMMRQWTKTEKHFAKAVKEKYWETIIRCDKHGNQIDKP